MDTELISKAADLTLGGAGHAAGDAFVRILACVLDSLAGKNAGAVQPTSVALPI